MDDYSGAGGGGSAAGGIVMMLGVLIVSLGVYVFYAYCWKRICEKLGKDPGPMIWIPIVQFIPILNAVDWETWKIVLFLIPLVNLVMAILLFLEILKRLEKSPALIVMLFIPCVSFFFLPYLAFSGGGAGSAATA